MSEARPRRRPHRAVLSALAVLLVVVAAVVAWRAADANEPPPDFGVRAAPSAAPSTEPSGGTPSAKPSEEGAEGEKPRTLPRFTVPQSDGAAEAADPVRLSIEGTGLDAAVVPVGVDDEGLVAVPEDAAKAGWYRFGPAPGEGRGSAVLMGHVDDDTGALGALAVLHQVKAGDTVRVARDGAPAATYRVTARQVIDRDELPAELFRRDGSEVLTLITCAAPYEKDRGGYQNNLVVTASPVGGEG